MFAQLEYAERGAKTPCDYLSSSARMPDLVGTKSLIAAVIMVLIVIACYIASYCAGLKPGPTQDTFWTRYGGAVPPGEQVRRYDAADVPAAAWADTYWPPNYCEAVPPPVKGEPERLGRLDRRAH